MILLWKDNFFNNSSIYKIIKKQRKEGYLTTSADTITDLFMMRIQNDYILNNIYSTSGSIVLTNYTEPFLLDAIDLFSPVSEESLVYTEGTASAVGYFTADLSREAKNILSKIMVLSWAQRQVSNLLAMSRYVVDRDFRVSAPMLPSLQNYCILKTEEIDKLLSDYAFRNLNWDNWQNQLFDQG